jgi:hypothetical protein
MNAGIGNEAGTIPYREYINCIFGSVHNIKILAKKVEYSMS